jgi:hypothetical protein
MELENMGDLRRGSPWLLDLVVVALLFYLALVESM